MLTIITQFIFLVASLLLIIGAFAYYLFIYIPLKNEESLKREEEARYANIDSVIENALRG